MKKQRVSLKKLQQHKEELLRKIKVPSDGLPGSLSVSRLRCGKKECHCKDGQGHENWTLTYMAAGKKRVKHIPQDLVDRVRQKVDRGKTFKQAVNDVFVTNAELLVLLWKQKRRTE